MKNIDFSFTVYKQILFVLKEQHYTCLTLEKYCSFKKLPKRFIILRHDVDRKPKNALKMAKIENELGLKASYYFRIGKESNRPEIIKKIIKLGHEIGYHYEDLASANGNYEKALKTFENNLAYFNKFYPIKTMCMHGSPLSKWDNRRLWEKYNYKKYGILVEPYFDLNFNEILYITDASRTWNNLKVSLRDKVKSNFNVKINSANDIITILKSNRLPDKIMLSTHPHNWTNISMEWYKILLWQSFKNVVKRYMIR